MIFDRSFQMRLLIGSTLLVGCASAEALPEPAPAARGTVIEPREETPEEAKEWALVPASRRTAQDGRCDDGTQPTVEILETTKVLFRCADKIKLRVDCGSPPVVTKRRSDGGLSISCS